MGWLRRTADALGWATLTDLDAGKLESWLATERDERQLSARTWNAIAAAWTAFGRWASRRSVARLASNPFNELPKLSTAADKRKRSTWTLAPLTADTLDAAYARGCKLLADAPERRLHRSEAAGRGRGGGKLPALLLDDPAPDLLRATGTADGAAHLAGAVADSGGRFGRSDFATARRKTRAKLRRKWGFRAVGRFGRLFPYLECARYSRGEWPGGRWRGRGS